MLFRRFCAACRSPAERRSPLCSGCQGRVRGPGLLAVDRLPAGLDGVVALHHYDVQTAGLVLAAKNGGQRRLLTLWGRQLADALLAPPAGSGSAVRPFDVVTWVPASRSGVRRRGYDQGRVLARATAAKAGLTSRRLLVRRAGRAQSGSDRRQRLVGPAVRAPMRCPPRVLLIDDVATTGTSLSVSARALRSAGARHVIGLVVAVAIADARRDRGARHHDDRRAGSIDVA